MIEEFFLQHINGILVFFASMLAIGAGIIIYRLCYNYKHMEYKTKYEKLLTLKTQSEIRLGAIGEHLAPFLSSWPFSTAADTFFSMGGIIDGINFGFDKITFVEIKTGNSKLSQSQRRIRDLISAGKVDFLEFRISEDGIKEKWTNKIGENDVPVEEI
jgi:predicted Holliday junction resolvase-like endonuclease